MARLRVKIDSIRTLAFLATAFVAACGSTADPTDEIDLTGGTGASGGTAGSHGGTANAGHSQAGTNSTGLGGSGGTGAAGGTGASGGTGGTGNAGMGNAGTGGSSGSAMGGMHAGGMGGAVTDGGRVGFGGRGGRGGMGAGGAAAGTSGMGSAGKAGGGSGGGAGMGPLPKFVGNISTGNSIDTNGMKFYKYWDQFSPENAGKWGSVQSSASGSFNWTTLDQFYAYTEQNKIIFKQHNFVWGSQQPSGTPTKAQVEKWIQSFCERYPNTRLIDVVNEPPPHTTPNYTANLGAGESGTYGWITAAFKLARQHCPGMVLILNDYNNLEYSDQENHFIDIVTQVKSGGGPIDGVGCQAHALKGKSASQLQSAIDTMASKTSLPVYITEYDIGDASDSGQLATYQAQFPVFLNTASVKGITVWGWIVGRTWVSNTGLVNNTTPRPAMTWLMQQLGRPNPPN
jgi:endo-1,4-beta-xylanase